MEESSSTFDLLQERFPKLALLAPTWQMGASPEEEIPGVDPGKAEALYIYGLGGGAPYFQSRKWLKSDPDRKLIFIEDDAGAFAAFLEGEKAAAVLEDPQVHIELIARNEDLGALVEKFPRKRVEMFAILSKNKSRFRSLKLALLRKATLAHALFLDRLHGYQPLQNFAKNLKQLPGSFYANGLKGKFKDVPAIVCGAGPSLNLAIETLKKLEDKALIIAGGSTIAALSAKGITPHFGMAIDPNLEEYRRMRNSFAFEMPLLYSTRVFPAVFQTASGPFGYMRSGIGGVAEVWMEEELGLLDPLIGEHLSSESISVTAICTAWAEFLGCPEIYFCGVDLAYTGKRRYADGVIEEGETLFSLLDAEKAAADRILKRKDRHGKTVHTAVRWVMESASLSHFAKKHKEIDFFNTTDGGIGIDKVPFMPIEEAAAGMIEKPGLRKRVERAIAASPMPNEAQAVIGERMEELKESLKRMAAHLEILSGQAKGSKPLSEYELSEEMAMPILFFDIGDLLNRSAPIGETDESRWLRFLTLVKKYQWTLST